MQVYRTPLLTLDPDAKAGGGLVEVVTLADAQARVESLQGQLKQLDRTLADVYAQRDGLQRELVASKAENSRLMGVAEQQQGPIFPSES